LTSELSDSLWHATCREPVSAPALAGDRQADLVIVGGGYTGLSAALFAAQQGAKTCLVEGSEFGAGGSGRNVGLSNAGLWLPPEDINARLGKAAGARLSSILGGAPDLVYQLIAHHGIACEPVRNGTLHCAHALAGMDDLKRRHAQLSAIGAPVLLLSRDEAVSRVGSDRVHGAIFDPRAGTIQPLAYAKGLARAAMEQGAELFEHSPATAITHCGKNWCVTTPKGRISAPAMIVATNAYAMPSKGLASPDLVPVHYFQAATAPLSPQQRRRILPGGEGCWDTAMVMSSWRLDQEGRLIIGGMGRLDHPAGGIHRRWLDRKLAQMFPELAGTKMTHAWFGRIAMTAEYLPKIQDLGQNALMAFGYSGRGIGPGTVFGQEMARAVLAQSHTDLPIAPVTEHSYPLAGLREAYYEAGATLTHLLKNRW